jgi:RNA polymerase sigma factor (sigma-70 family)
MSVRSIEVLQRYLRRLCEEAEPAEDAVLLKRFVTAQDREAFELLMARHGPMVLGTARRLVANTHDAEDVFQAVFLSLARLAKSIRRGRALPAWLHQTTCRVAAKLRAHRLVQAAPPERYEQCDPAAGLVWREVCQALDEELQRLPERLRSPLMLCYLSGLARDEAARQLGWSLGTLKRRLEEGRQALRIRLARRGIASVGLALTVLTPEALQAAVSQSLLDSSLRLVVSPWAVVPASISALALNSATATKGLAMKAILALLAVIAVGVGIYAGTGQADPPPQAGGNKEEARPARGEHVVQWDDPLPAGSTMRLGTSRFRQGVGIVAMTVSADGETAFVCNGTRFFGSVRAFDLVSGLPRFTLKNVEAGAVALSPDERTLVTKQELQLHLRDARTGQELRTIDSPKKDQWSDVLVFTPDGKAIATTSAGMIHLIDFASGKPIRAFPHEGKGNSKGGGGPTRVVFSPDGKRMAAGDHDTENDAYFVRLWEVETGKELRRLPHGKRSYDIRSLAFSPDGKTLATGAHDGRLRLWDVDTGTERHVFSSAGYRQIRSVAFTPDGQTVAAAGPSIRLYDAATGVERLRIDRAARDLHFRDGGKTLTAAVDGAVYRWDTATGKPLTPTSAHDSVVGHILVTPDGGRIVTRGQEGEAHVWDGTTGKHLRALQGNRQGTMALSPNGRYLAWAVAGEDVRIRLYDLAADKLVERFPAFKMVGQDMAFTAGGKTLVTVDYGDGMVRFWDVETGKEQRSFRAVPAAEKDRSNHLHRTAVSPDGKTLAVAYAANTGGVDRLSLVPPSDVLRLWDMASGKELRRLDARTYYVMHLAFSPDGRLLVSASEVWDVVTGKRVPAVSDGLPLAVFSGDGRSLATVSYEGMITAWEIATWTVRTRFKSPHERTTALAFTPAGQVLCGGLDTTVLAHDIRPPHVAGPVSLDSAWNDLATREAGASFQSEGRFLAAPAETVQFFAKQITPPQTLEVKRVQRLLADLDSGVFAVREAAVQSLLGLDEQAIPYLEATLKNAPPLEVRVRVQKILEQKQTAAIPSEQLRQVRALTVLEQIGDDESKKLLKRWAGGPVGARLTVEAAAALNRLAALSKANR